MLSGMKILSRFQQSEPSHMANALAGQLHLRSQIIVTLDPRPLYTSKFGIRTPL